MSAKPKLARRSVAESAAQKVLHDLKIDTLRVDPIAIAGKHGIAVEAKPDNVEGVSGALIKAGDQFGILYATHIQSIGFQRFSIAHELGHYFTDGHTDALLENNLHVSRAGFTSADPFEQEADYFAASLLMPERPFKRALDSHKAGLTCVDALSAACETSLTATAIRYASLTADGVAVIATTGQSVDWCFMSEALKEAKGLNWLRKGTPVPGGTLTAAFNADPENIRGARRDSGDGRLNDWLDGERVYKVVEEVVGLGQYGRSLTLLTCPALSGRGDDDPGDDDEERDLIESWTPRFR